MASTNQSSSRAYYERFLVGVVLVLLVGLGPFPVKSASSTNVQFSFAFGGDTGQYGSSYGTAVNGTGSFFDTAASLQALPPGLSFFVDDGDISYNGTSNGFPPTGNEVLWCNFVKTNIQANLGSNFPWIQVVGNHEDGNSPFARDGYIDAFTAPNCLPKPTGIAFVPSTVGCPDASLLTGCYGREGYWDYPPASPVARFIMIAGAEKVGVGNVTTAYSYCPLNVCGNLNFDRRWSWLKTTIDSAKAQGEWVVVFDHKPCLSPDTATACEGNGTFNNHNPGAQKWNLFFSEGVDLVINGHAHVYARSNQLSCDGPSEPWTSLPSNVTYSSSCVVNNGSSNVYTRGHGLINVINGVFSQIDGQLNFTRPDIQYFATAMSARVTPTVSPSDCCWINGSAIDMNSGVGFGEVTVSATSLSYNWHMSLETHFIGHQAHVFSDSFTIQSPPPSQTASQTGSILQFIQDHLMVIGAAAVIIGMVVVVGAVRLSRNRSKRVSQVRRGSRISSVWSPRPG